MYHNIIRNFHKLNDFLSKFQPKTTKFEFPDLFKTKSQDEENLKSLDEAKKAFKSYIKRNKDRPDVPSWFSF